MAPLLDGIFTNPPCNRCGKETNESLRCSVLDNQNLCQECFHSLPEASREDIGDPEWVCTDHCSTRVEFFCKTCQAGFCIKCLGDTHEGHDVVGLLEYSAEIRCDLVEQLQQVSLKEERLTQVREKFEDYNEEKDTAFGEVFQVIDKVINKSKKEVEIEVEEEVGQVIREKEEAISKLEETILQVREQADAKIRKLKSEASNSYQELEKVKSDAHAVLLRDEEPRNRAILKLKTDLQDRKVAYESAKTEIRFSPRFLTENCCVKGSIIQELGEDTFGLPRLI